MSTEYRAYYFGNMYLSPIQQGIQATHVTSNMFCKYQQGKDDGFARVVLYDWAVNFKTVILLNGGFQSALQEIYNQLEILAPKLQLPFDKFHEEKDALNGALTSVGIVVPDFVYDLEIPEYLVDLPERYKHFSDESVNATVELKNLLSQYRLA